MKRDGLKFNKKTKPVNISAKSTGRVQESWDRCRDDEKPRAIVTPATIKVERDHKEKQEPYQVSNSEEDWGQQNQSIRTLFFYPKKTKDDSS